MDQPAASRAPTGEPVLRRLKAELERRYGDRLERVLLFGSRARGEARPDSDWDVAVFLRGYDGKLDEYKRLSDFELEVLLETGKAVSVKFFAPEELERRTLLMHNLRRDGT